MKCMVHFELAVLLFCGVLLSAQTGPPPTEQKPESANSEKKQKPPSATASDGPIDVLTDTMGVDFGPYLKQVKDKVRQNWYNLIPESARPPIMRKGKVSIEFAITKDGRVAGMQIVSTSGDVALDRAAYGGITSNNPFPPLPAEFMGQYLGLRFTFYYNPDRGELPELAASPTSQPAKSGVKVSVFPHDTLDVPVGGSDVVIASVQGTKNPAVTWSIAGQGCSGATCGTIDDEGLYHAPSALPNPPSVTVTAVSRVDPNASASVTIHLVPAPKP
jgi:TonB family protein